MRGQPSCAGMAALHDYPGPNNAGNSGEQFGPGSPRRRPKPSCPVAANTSPRSFDEFTNDFNGRRQSNDADDVVSLIDAYREYKCPIEVYYHLLNWA